MPDSIAAKKAEEYLKTLIQDNNSSGGIIECIIKNTPSGLGDPVFDKCDANLAKAIMSIGSVKGVEIGNGFTSAKLTGYENNDFYRYENGTLIKETNNAGGILGGITDGSNIVIRAAIKPTPSISKTQSTININKENTEINIKGRHDPIIVPRAVIVVESMVAITLVDLLFKNMTSKIDYIVKAYS